ncbi:hypothetical protein Ahu01nite_045850 [Winogradskya humida]|uniref:Secreted protein n=1 Tax=Winogradskya humida TaxID=113566 RepID=A0ABQ3ZSE1_9ACTN|nr:hypothetical protein Ahu01nite_045850 [Actinoplanes humidus]
MAGLSAHLLQVVWLPRCGRGFSEGSAGRREWVVSRRTSPVAVGETASGVDRFRQRDEGVGVSPSGPRQRRRLNARGNRRLTMALHIIVVQAQRPGLGGAY